MEKEIEDLRAEYERKLKELQDLLDAKQRELDQLIANNDQVYLENSETEKAVEMLKKIETEFFYDILADDAIYTLAEIYQKNLEDKEKAKALYEKILLEFKGSIYTSEARKRFRKLRGDNLKEKENL